MDRKFESREKVYELSRMLSKKIPNFQYGSASTLFREGYKANLITKEELEMARDFYGNLWNYAGD
jgi:hypothetical protein